MTGPTVVQPLLRDLRLRPRLKTILEAEGVLIDPIGALLAGFILQLVIRPGVSTLAAQTGGIAVSIGFGLLAGLAAGFLLAGALRYRLIGDPRDDRTMQRARMELVGTVIGLTFSEHANSLFVREAREAYGVARGYVAMESFEDQHAPRLVRRSRLDVLFDGPHDQACWDVRWRHDEVDVEGFEYRLDVAPGSVTPDTGNAKTGTPGAGPGPGRPVRHTHGPPRSAPGAVPPGPRPPPGRHRHRRHPSARPSGGGRPPGTTRLAPAGRVSGVRPRSAIIRI